MRLLLLICCLILNVNAQSLNNLKHPNLSEGGGVGGAGNFGRGGEGSSVGGGGNGCYGCTVAIKTLLESRKIILGLEKMSKPYKIIVDRFKFLGFPADFPAKFNEDKKTLEINLDKWDETTDAEKKNIIDDFLLDANFNI